MTSKWMIPALAFCGLTYAQETPQPEKQATPSETVTVVKPASGKCVIPIKNYMPKNHYSRMPQVPAPSEIDPKFVKDPPLPLCDEVDSKPDLRSASPANPQNRFPKLKILPGK